MEAPGGKAQIDDQHWLIPSVVIIALIIVRRPLLLLWRFPCFEAGVNGKFGDSRIAEIAGL